MTYQTNDEINESKRLEKDRAVDLPQELTSSDNLLIREDICFFSKPKILALIKENTPGCE